MRSLLRQRGIHSLLINTAGVDLVLIGVFVLYSAFDTLFRWFIPAANAVGRTLFALVVAYYCVAHDVARVVLVFSVADLLISGGFAYHLLKLRPLLQRTGPATA